MSAELSAFVNAALLIWAAIFLCSLAGLYWLMKAAAKDSAVEMRLRAHSSLKILLIALLTIALATFLFGPPILVNLLYIIGIGVPVALVVLGGPLILTALARLQT